MAVESLTNNQNLLYQVSAPDTQTKVAENTKIAENDETKAEGAAAVSTFKQDTDTAAVFEKKSNAESVYEDKTIQDMLEESNLKAENFKNMIEKLLNTQSAKYNIAYPENAVSNEQTGAVDPNASEGNTSAANAEFSIDSIKGNMKDFYSNLNVDEETKLKAQEDVSEDGYYGVKNTSDRILSFAKSLAGDDPDKLEQMYSAFEEGYKKAESDWGGELPEISQKTYDAVKQGFEDWRNELSMKAATSANIQSQAATAQIADNSQAANAIEQNPQNNANGEESNPGVAVQSISGTEK